mgnify:CR=1 FL=1
MALLFFANGDGVEEAGRDVGLAGFDRGVEIVTVELTFSEG